jgi:dTDP-4-dehydrorhamnose 3,5-epimerase
VKIIKGRRSADLRGWLSETYNERALREFGIKIHFVQDNHVLPFNKGTVRGMHYQIPPFAQDKLLRVVSGAIFDVAVDVRFGSPTFGQYVSAVISAAEWNQILVPAGFAHGLLTLEPHTEVIYKVSNYHSPEHEAGFVWNDPALGIDWPIGEGEAIISDRDRRLPYFADLPAHFHYGPTESSK